MVRPGGSICLQRSTYSGPAERRQPDRYLYRASSLEAALEEALYINGEQYYIYGDQAYVLRSWLQTEFPRATANAAQMEYNKSMNAALISVEWNYKYMKQMWASQDFGRLLQVCKVLMAALYITAVLLRNFETCLGHGTESEHAFACTPPTLHTYLGCEAMLINIQTSLCYFASTHRVFLQHLELDVFYQLAIFFALLLGFHGFLVINFGDEYVQSHI
eukprot:IDg7751t1